MNDHWRNWLAGQAFLETDYRNEHSHGSSAKGYFQFLAGTAEEAVAHGLPDPRHGSYDEQAEATMKWIMRYHPTAATSIESGAFTTAAYLLKRVWPSLPEGNQRQAANRYATWNEILEGGGPRPPTGV
jgi:muramidase (phage lysozyme)